jgi:hypothetical protein
MEYQERLSFNGNLSIPTVVKIEELEYIKLHFKLKEPQFISCSNEIYISEESLFT